MYPPSIGNIVNVALKSDNIILLLTFRTFLRFDGQDFETVGSSQFSHRETFGLGNYKGQALTTGCCIREMRGCERAACSIKTELLNMTTMTWSNTISQDFPSIV